MAAQAPLQAPLQTPVQAAQPPARAQASAVLSDAGAASGEVSNLALRAGGAPELAQAATLQLPQESHLAEIIRRQSGQAAPQEPPAAGRLVAGLGAASAVVRRTSGVVQNASQNASQTLSVRPVRAYAPARLQSAVLVRPAPGAYGLREADPNLFGTVALPVGRTPEDAKWIRARAFVPSAAGGPWAGVVRNARSMGMLARLETVNRWVNQRIAYATPEAQYGVADYWATASESLTSGRGNCTAYAIAKYELLRAAGVPAEDMYLMLVRDLVRRADHAIVAVRVEGRFVILDSGADAVLSAEEVHDYRPILTYSLGHTWIHGYRQQAPQLIMASNERQPNSALQ